MNISRQSEFYSMALVGSTSFTFKKKKPPNIKRIIKLRMPYLVSPVSDPTRPINSGPKIEDTLPKMLKILKYSADLFLGMIFPKKDLESA